MALSKESCDHIRFFRLAFVIVDELTECLQDILSSQPSCFDITERLNTDNSLKQKLSSDQIKVLQQIENNGFSECDITLLCVLLSNVCHDIKQPTQGWGKTSFPGKSEKKLGDDIERIRLIRNQVFGDMETFAVSEEHSRKYWVMIHDICERIENTTGKNMFLRLQAAKHRPFNVEQEILVKEGSTKTYNSEEMESRMRELKKIVDQKTYCTVVRVTGSNQERAEGMLLLHAGDILNSIVDSLPENSLTGHSNNVYDSLEKFIKTAHSQDKVSAIDPIVQNMMQKISSKITKYAEIKERHKLKILKRYMKFLLLLGNKYGISCCCRYGNPSCLLVYMTFLSKDSKRRFQEDEESGWFTRGLLDVFLFPLQLSLFDLKSDELSIFLGNTIIYPEKKLSQDFGKLIANLDAIEDQEVLLAFFKPLRQELLRIDMYLLSGQMSNPEMESSLQEIELWKQYGMKSARGGHLWMWVETVTFEDEVNFVKSTIEKIRANIKSEVTNVPFLLDQLLHVLENGMKDEGFKNLNGTALFITKSGEIANRLEWMPKGVLSGPRNYEEDSTLPAIDINDFQSFETDVFSFYKATKTDVAPIPFELQNPSGNDIYLYMEIPSQKTVDRLYRAHVRDSVWNKAESLKLKRGILLRTKRVREFCIIGEFKRRDLNIPPNGLSYIHGSDNRVKIDIPADAVGKACQQLQLQVIPVRCTEMKENAVTPDEDNIYAISKAVRLHGTVRKPVTVELPIENLKDEGDQDEETEYILFHIVGDQVEIFHEQHVDASEGIVKTSVASFSAVGAYKRSKRSNNFPSTMSLRMCFCNIFKCKFLTFYKKSGENSGHLWCEVVRKERWEEIMNKREASDLFMIEHSLSSDVYLGDGERVRVDVSGNAKFRADFRRECLFLNFHPISDDIHVFPPLDKKLVSGVHPGCTVYYTRDTKLKECLHSVSFDPWSFRPKKRRRSGLSRSASTCTIESTNSSRGECDSLQSESASFKEFDTSGFGTFLYQYGIENYEQIFSQNGVDCIAAFMEMKQKDFIEMGLLRGQALKCCSAITHYKSFTK